MNGAMTSPSDEHFVLFADILGSGAAVETEPRFLSYYYERVYDRPNEVHEEGSPLAASRVVYSYSRFHAAVTDLLRDRVPDSWDIHTLIVFSDSVILASTSHHLADYARWLMQRCIVEGVAVRMGLGVGAFVVGRFASEITGRRRVFASQFLGSGVVRAYWAESAGVKGIRILLHPSAADALAAVKRANQLQLRTLALPSSEASGKATHELSYILQPDERDDEVLPFESVRVHIERLRGMAPAKVRDHYAATAAALERMAAAVNG